MWLVQIARLNLLWHPPHSDQVGIANLATEWALGNGPIKDEHVDLVFACKHEYLWHYNFCVSEICVAEICAEQGRHFNENTNKNHPILGTIE